MASAARWRFSREAVDRAACVFLASFTDLTTGAEALGGWSTLWPRRADEEEEGDEEDERTPVRRAMLLVVQTFEK